MYILRESFRYRRSQSHLSIILHPGQMPGAFRFGGKFALFGREYLSRTAVLAQPKLPRCVSDSCISVMPCKSGAESCRASFAPGLKRTRKCPACSSQADQPAQVRRPVPRANAPLSPDTGKKFRLRADDGPGKVGYTGRVGRSTHKLRKGGDATRKTSSDRARFSTNRAICNHTQRFERRSKCPSIMCFTRTT
jgi:hypothetical protein